METRIDPEQFREIADRLEQLCDVGMEPDEVLVDHMDQTFNFVWRLNHDE